MKSLKDKINAGKAWDYAEWEIRTQAKEVSKKVDIGLQVFKHVGERVSGHVIQELRQHEITKK